jgi:hypothetical protein
MATNIRGLSVTNQLNVGDLSIQADLDSAGKLIQFSIFNDFYFDALIDQIFASSRLKDIS